MDKLKYYVSLPHRITLKKVIDLEKIYYIAKIPELRGCISYGDTVKEVLANIKHSKIAWVDDCLFFDTNIPIPYDSKQIVEILKPVTKIPINIFYKKTIPIIYKFDEIKKKKRKKKINIPDFEKES